MFANIKNVNRKVTQFVNCFNNICALSRQRNPKMADLAAKTMIYRGLGSGIIQVMREDANIDFTNEESANQFKVTI